MTIATRPKLTLSKSVLTEYVRTGIPAWQKTPKARLLEKKYGKYLYLPLDIPAIVPDEPLRFKQWFLEKAIPVYKRQPDIANPGQLSSYVDPSFLSIDSHNISDLFSKTPTWDVNPVSDMYEKFPEIKTQIDTHMPFTSIEYYTLWSSMWPVSPHRDENPLCDMPFAFRITLYDENPKGTLRLLKGLPDMRYYHCESKVIEYLPSNAFAWNNLRALHASQKFKDHMKILMIVAPTYRNQVDYDKIEALFDASIDRYKDELWYDTNELEDYIDVSAKY